MKKVSIPLIFSIILAGLFAAPVQADGIIIPDPPFPPEPGLRPMQQLVIEYHHVDVLIDEQIAVTRVDQVFYNPNDWVVEGVYLFPLPADAVVTDFVLWIDGEPVKGEILSAEEARDKYEQIIREMRDPALLEYVGRGAVQASIFPIAPGEKRRIELEYSQVLTADTGLVRYIYPLNTEKFSSQPLQSVKIGVEIHSQNPIRAVYSPTHPVDIVRENEQRIIAGYEDEDITPDSDFALYYSVGDTEAFHLFSFRDPENIDEDDGFFMLLLAPSPDEETQVIAKDVLLVLDRSGSMEGEKFRQAQAALQFILQRLNPEDRFYVTAFSTGIETFSDDLQSTENVQDAIDWVDRMSAAGSTDINRALLETVLVAQRERPTYLIFLTDGLPTEGVTDSNMILTNFEKEAKPNIRLFTFGVGYDVDTFLLDSLSKDHHGLSTYVQPGEALDEVLSSFYNRISTPVLTNIELDFNDLSIYDLYPQPLPDLFSGSQVLLVGRYRQGGMVDITLRGEVNGIEREFKFPAQNFERNNGGESDVLANLPRLWATRKIGYLLNQIRLEGPDQETIDQIVHLSIRFGIITPYTSYLVTEPMPLGAANQAELARDAYEESLAAPMIVSGQQAVEKAAQEGELAQAEIAPRISTGQESVRNVWFRSFVQSGNIWMDTAYDPEAMDTIQVAFLSIEYFALAASRPDISAALALGESVIIIIDGNAYEIVPDGETDFDFTLPGNLNDEPGDTQEVLPTDDIQSTADTVKPAQISSDPDSSDSATKPLIGNLKLNPSMLIIGIGTAGGIALLILLLRGFFQRK